jgi:hypothetical protein
MLAHDTAAQSATAGHGLRAKPGPPDYDFRLVR